ncbi:MAG: hypothetical protein AB1899_12100 [Pseudomonadota bacterium]
MPSIRVFLILLLLVLVLPARAAVDVAIRLPSGAEVVSQRYPAEGKVLAVWLTGQYGRIEEEHKAAADLAARGVETWLTDFFAPYFLPLLPSSWNQVPDGDLADWLQALHRQHPERRILLVSTGRAASLALRAVNSWRQRFGKTGDEAVQGALLLYPLLYQELAPGEEPEYDPVVNEARMDLVILQPKSSAGYWWRERLKGFLEAAGSRVWLDVLPGLRDGFYRRSDITEQEVAAGQRLGQIVLDGMQPLLEKFKP